MQIEDLQLKFSNYWMRHFKIKSRHGLHYKKAHGEAKSADFAAVQEWLANRYATAFLKNRILVTLGLGAILKKRNSDFIYFNGRVGP